MTKVNIMPSFGSRRGAESRRAAEAFGRHAEAAVAEMWAARGFQVLARRLRTGVGEIDLVVADPEMLVFVEVKARRSAGDIAYAVQPRQQLRLLAAAESAIATHSEWQRPTTRFDVAFVFPGSIEHIEDAIRYS